MNMAVREGADANQERARYTGLWFVLWSKRRLH